MYQLLLGITALSLLASPLVIIMCSRLLRELPLSPSTVKAAGGAAAGGRAAGAGVPESLAGGGGGSGPDSVVRSS